MNRRFGLSISLAALVLAGALAVQTLTLRDSKAGDLTPAVRPIRLADQFPLSLGAWRGRDEPLGPNESTQSEVARTLNYDDYVYRIYESNGQHLGVYVAYWSPGRMPLQKVASHTPDRCWTENGWTCDEMRFRETVASGAEMLRPANWRRFTPPSGGAKPEYVLFWHLIGDQLYDYGDRFSARPDVRKWWRDTLRFAFTGSEAQYFIRVTSDRSFETLRQDHAWGELVAILGRLGLSVRTETSRQ
jgi:hypothetical protein